MVVCSTTGATILFLNTDFAGPQRADTLAREGGVALIADEEFDALLPDDALPGRRFVGFGSGAPGRPTLEELAGRFAAPVPPPPQAGRLVILTSGTTGVPKGAARSSAPLFHGWCLLNFTLAPTLPPEVRARYDTSSLTAIPLSDSAIPGDLATRAMDAFGDVVFNFYGSTETGWASIATPADLRAAPGTAGRPPFGARLND